MGLTFSFVFQDSESWTNQKETSEGTILRSLRFCGHFMLLSNSSSRDSLFLRSRGAYLPFEIYFRYTVLKHFPSFLKNSTRKIEMRLLHSLSPSQSQLNWGWHTSVGRCRPPTSLNKQINAVKCIRTIRLTHCFFAYFWRHFRIPRRYFHPF